MSTTTATRYTVERFDNGWHVVGSDADDNVVSLSPVSSRQAGRDLARQLREVGTEAPEAPEAPEATTLAEVTDAVDRARDAGTLGDGPNRFERNAEGGVIVVPADQVAEHVTPKPTPEPAAPAPVVKAAKAARVTLARVAVGDRLMTNLVTEGNGIVYAAPHRFSDGQVRTVAEVTTRKAGDGEMPGTLYTLVFEDGTVSEERYGTTSHYPAEAFPGDQPTPAAPPEKLAAVRREEGASAPAKPAPAPKVPTTPSRAGKLQVGDRLVVRDLGVVTVTGLSKTGDGKVEVAYDSAGVAGVREMWASTNVRLAAKA